MSLRLAIKAGSLHEADDQQGLAHLIEHMAFNGSTHFKPGEVFSYFESVGAQLGPHVNASTSFDQTIYRLDLPTDKPEVVAKGLTALSDFAGGLTLDPVQIDKERGVVIEEWRGRLGAGSRLRDAQIPVHLLPVALRRAAPDRQAGDHPERARRRGCARSTTRGTAPSAWPIVAVGDIDAQQMEAAIRATFGPLKARGAAGPTPDDNIPLHRELHGEGLDRSRNHAVVRPDA